MTDTPPAPAADPVRPVPSLVDVTMRAYRLHGLADALDMVHDHVPIEFPPSASEYERRAANSQTCIIELIRDMARTLADDLDRLNTATRTNGKCQCEGMVHVPIIG